MDTIHARIAARREQLGLSMEGLADLVGVSWQSVQQWENGSTIPRRHRMEKIANALMTTVMYLESGTDPTYAPVRRIEARDAQPPGDQHGWPFKRIDIERILQLSEEDRDFIEHRIMAAVEHCEATKGKRRLPAAG
jgi:transcriptional regulator with XRE-family HTH domain